MTVSGSDRCGRDGRRCLIRVLGPVDVVVDGEVVTAGSRLERTLLAALVVSANHAVSSDQLADVLWGDDPPSSRDNTLQSYVSRLRHLVGHETILSEEHSYTLVTSTDQIDAVTFERLAEAAGENRFDPACCSKLCREGLSLWRGTPFGDLADVDPFRLEALRLDGLRLFVVELDLAAQIALGREGIVVGALEAFTQEHPYRERMWQLLIAALALNGRRTEALRSYDALRDLLGEVGLAPSSEARELHRRVLDERADIRTDLLSMMAGSR